MAGALPPWCEATADLTPDEVAQLDALPDGHNELETTIRCALQGGHPDPHMTMGQAYNFGDECWLRWGDGVRELFHIPDEAFCPAEDAESGNVCLLPAGHFDRCNLCLD